MLCIDIWHRVILLLYHLKFWNILSAGITDRKLLYLFSCKTTSNKGLIEVYLWGDFYLAFMVYDIQWKFLLQGAQTSGFLSKQRETIGQWYSNKTPLQHFLRSLTNPPNASDRNLSFQINRILYFSICPFILSVLIIDENLDLS